MSVLSMGMTEIIVLLSRKAQPWYVWEPVFLVNEIMPHGKKIKIGD